MLLLLRQLILCLMVLGEKFSIDRPIFVSLPLLLLLLLRQMRKRRSRISSAEKR